MKDLFKVFTQYKGLPKSIYVIFFARVITSMGAFIWPVMTFIMSGKMGLSATQIGLFSAILGLLFIPAGIIGGKLTDRFNKKKIIIFFDSLSILLFFACSFMEPNFIMLITFALAGLFAHVEAPAFDALFMEASKPNEREKVYSLSYLGMNLGLVFGATMGGLLYENYLSLAFILDGLTTLTSTLLIIAFVKPVKLTDIQEHEKNEYENDEELETSSLKILMERKSVLIVIILAVFTSFIYSQWSFSIPLYLSELFGDGEGAKIYGTIVSFNGLIVILFTPIFTSMLARFKELPKMAIGVGLYSVSYLMITNEPMKYTFFIMTAIFTFGEVINTIGSYPFISRRIPATHRGRISSYMSMAISIGFMSSQLIAGVINDHLGYNATFVLMAIIGVLYMFVVGINYKIDKKTFPKLYE